MGSGLQVVTGFVTAPSTTFTPWTMASGDQLAVRNAPDGTDIRLLTFWAANQAAGQIRIRSPLLHDNVIGMSPGVVASEPYPLIEYAQGQKLKPQDTLIVEQTGSAVGGQIEQGSLLIYYPELPGANARLTNWAAIQNRIEAYMYGRNIITTGAGGGYTGSQVINSSIDQWKANRDYALLGYQCSALCCTVGITGPDTSNLRVGGPGHPNNRQLTNNWFVWLSNFSGYPCIPILNSANKGATTVDVAQNQAAAAVTITWIFALLN